MCWPGGGAGGVVSRRTLPPRGLGCSSAVCTRPQASPLSRRCSAVCTQLGVSSAVCTRPQAARGAAVQCARGPGHFAPRLFRSLDRAGRWSPGRFGPACPRLHWEPGARAGHLAGRRRPESPGCLCELGGCRGGRREGCDSSAVCTHTSLAPGVQQCSVHAAPGRPGCSSAVSTRARAFNLSP